MRSQKRREFLVAASAVGAGISAGCTSLVETDEEHTGDSDDDGDPIGETSTDDGDPASDDETADETPADELGDTIEDFEDLSAWQLLDDNGAFDAETDDVATGSQALRIRADEDEPYVGVTRSFSDPLDLTEKNLSLALNAETPKAHQIELRLLAPDEENALHLGRTHTGPTDHWLRADLGATSDVGDPDLGTVTELQLIGRERDGGAAIDYTVDDVRTVDAPDQGLVVLTWDDNHESTDTAFELMEAYDFPGVVGVIPHSVGADDRLDLEQLVEMRDAGWDVVSHPHPEGRWGLPLSALEDAEQRETIAESAAWLREHGFEAGADHYIAPNHTRDATTLEVLREHHESSASFGGANVGVPLTDTHTIGRIDGYDPDTVKRFVDLAATYKQACIPLWHVIGEAYDDHEITVDEYEDLLAYIDDADVRVVTQSELVARDF